MILGLVIRVHILTFYRETSGVHSMKLQSRLLLSKPHQLLR